MSDGPFWDELGIAWQAITPALEAHPDRLHTCFRRQSLLLGAALAGAILIGIGGTALGAFTLWQAWRLTAWNFATRGVALLIIALLACLAAGALWPVRRNENARALSELAAFGLARSTRKLRVVRFGLTACAAAIILGLVGTTVRTAAGHPPALSPVLDVAVIAIVALIFALYGFRARREQARFAYLRRSLSRS